MNPFLTYLLYGAVAGIPVFFIGLFFVRLYKNANERRSVKKMISEGKFLITIDPRDYDTEAWKPYIDINKTEADLNTLNQRIFKKAEHSDMLKDFILSVQDYVQKAKAKGRTETELMAEMKDNGYSEELINKVLGEKPLW